MEPVANNYTWTVNYYVLMIDYPYGSGYSYAGSPTDYKNTTSGTSTYLYQFLFTLTQKYPLGLIGIFTYLVRAMRGTESPKSHTKSSWRT